MRVLIALLVIIALAGGGTYVYWNKKAGEFKQMAVQAIDNINAVEKPFTKDKTFLTYSSIQVTGFPANIVVEVMKPVVEVPVSALLGEIQKQKGNEKPLPYEWVEEISYGDKVTFTGNLAGDRITFTTNGDHSEKAIINGAVRHSLVSTTSGPLTCSVDVEHVPGTTPWTFSPVFTDPKVFLNAFRSFDCGVRGISVKDAVSGAPIFTGDEVSFSIGNDSLAGGNHKMHFKMKMDDQQYTKAGDAVMYDYMLMFYTLTGQPDQAMPVTFSEFGKHSLDIDVAYDGPIDTAAMQDPAMNLHFDVNAFNAHTQLSSMGFDMHVATVPQGTERTFSIAMHGKGKASERSDQLAEQKLVAMLKNLNTPEAQAKLTMDPVEQLLHKAAALGKPEEIVGQAFPQFHTLGDTSFDFDMNVKGPNNNALFLRQSSLALDDLNWVATPYGIKVKGTANASIPGKMPVADFTITCDGCDALVNDLGNYAMRLESIAARLSTQPRPPFLNQDLIMGARQFLHGIAENGNASDLVIHFAMHGGNNFTISNKQLPEVLALYMSTIAPHLQASPSAGGMGAPPPMH